MQVKILIISYFGTDAVFLRFLSKNFVHYKQYYTIDLSIKHKKCRSFSGGVQSKKKDENFLNLKLAKKKARYGAESKIGRLLDHGIPFSAGSTLQ